MSRGPGWLQRRLLEELSKSDEEMHTDQLVVAAFSIQRDPDDGCFYLPTSQRASVHRALKQLADAGSIHCFGRGYRDKRCRWALHVSPERLEQEAKMAEFRKSQERALAFFCADMKERYGLRLSPVDAQKLFDKYCPE